MNGYVYSEENRHPPPRQECIDAGFDYPHEGPEYVVLAGEHSCPPCRQRLSQKLMLIEMRRTNDEIRRTNDLKQQELNAKIDGYWQEPEVRVVRQYIPPQRAEPQKSKPKGGIQIEPTGGS